MTILVELTRCKQSADKFRYFHFPNCRPLVRNALSQLLHFNPAALVLGLTLFITCPSLWARNVLENPGFESDLSGWTLSGNPLPTWDVLDVDGSDSSGSALVQNTEPGESTDVVVLSQCINVIPGIWELFAQVFIPEGQERTGSVVIRYRVFRDEDCTGGSPGTGGWLTTTTGRWIELTLFSPLNLTTNQIGDTGSISYIIAVRKTEGGGNFSAYIDNARVLFNDLIFRDGFEPD